MTFFYHPKNIPLIHFIGIGGIGMSGMAKILIQLGYKVQGSDLSYNHNIECLKDLGVNIFIGHDCANLQQATMVVYTSAVKPENPEYKMALELGLPLIPRGEMLAQLMRLKFGVAVGGTHGKTTTTSMLATIAVECGMDPTYLIGGIVPSLGGSARVGKSELLITESDESDGSFELLGPAIAIVTNIDDDHLDYHGHRDNLIASFESFLRRVPFYGLCILNLGNKQLAELYHRIQRPVLSFKLVHQLEEVSQIDYAALNTQFTEDGGMNFDLFYNGNFVQKMHINVPGLHNVENALAAITAGHHIGANFEQIAQALLQFQGVGRRVELLANKGTYQIIDDYAHHPTEIRAVIAALVESKKRKPIVFFELHRYSRTKSMWSEFLYSFTQVNKVYFLPIYSAQEEEIPGISARALMEDLNRLHPNIAEYLENYSEMKEVIAKIIGTQNEESLVVTLGAGSIGKKMREIIDELGLK